MADISEFHLDFFSLRGKSAIVTGGNMGLGRAFTLALGKAGANVLVPSIREDDGVTARLMAEAGAACECMLCDITQKGMPRAIVDRCAERFGAVDILVNNAGTCKIADVRDFGRALWDPMIELNLNAAFEMSHEAALRMIEQGGGKIINVCSLFSFLGGLGSPAYAAMKHGLAGLTKAYCDELGKYNIQVNGIAPGYYATDITRQTREDPEANRRVLEHIPAGRWGDTLDLMGAAVFLASRASDYVSGHLLVVDGGYLVR
ncbi:MAG: SDR family oxidoreductase [Clostridia bacterium]|nr:SDR family oxidoreductase [Clostridia bacterium]